MIPSPVMAPSPWMTTRSASRIAARSQGQGPLDSAMTRSAAGPKALPALPDDPVVRGEIHTLEDAAARDEDGRRNHRSQDGSPPWHEGVVILRTFPELRPGNVFLGDDPADPGARLCNHRLEREGCSAITPVRAAGRAGGVLKAAGGAVLCRPALEPQLHRCLRSRASSMNKTPAIDDAALQVRMAHGVPAFPHSAFREMEAALSDPLFFGIPLGATLNDCFITAFVDGLGDWRWRTKWLRRLLYHRHRIAPKIHRSTGATFAQGRVLVTWSAPSHRYDRLLLPVLERLGEGECAVLHGHDGVAPLVPAGIPHLPYREVMDFDARAWRREYERCWPSWKRTLRDACARYAFPEGAFELLSLELMVASQRVLGCLGFLEAQDLP